MVNKGLNKGEINNLFETMDANKVKSIIIMMITIIMIMIIIEK
jgi:hypothetical protein